MSSQVVDLNMFFLGGEGVLGDAACLGGGSWVMLSVLGVRDDSRE